MKTKQQENQNFAGKVVAGVAAVGAAVVAAKVLSDPKNREKISEGFEKAKEKGNELVEKLSAEFERLKGEVSKDPKFQEFQEKVKMIGDDLKEIRNSNEKDVNDLVNKVKKQIEELKAKLEEKSMEVKN